MIYHSFKIYSIQFVFYMVYRCVELLSTYWRRSLNNSTCPEENHEDSYSTISFLKQQKTSSFIAELGRLLTMICIRSISRGREKEAQIASVGEAGPPAWLLETRHGRLAPRKDARRHGISTPPPMPQLYLSRLGET